MACDYIPARFSGMDYEALRRAKRAISDARELLTRSELHRDYLARYLRGGTIMGSPYVHKPDADLEKAWLCLPGPIANLF
jgi:hypothetical protein